MEKIIDGQLPVSPGSKAGRELYRYCVSIRFHGASVTNMRLDVFDAIKGLGVFSIQNQKDHLYTLDFRTQFTKSGLEERLGELAGPAKRFEYTVEEVPAPEGKIRRAGGP